MAYVGEEAALGLVELDQLPIALLQLAPVLVQLVAQAKLPVAKPVEEVIPGDDN